MSFSLLIKVLLLGLFIPWMASAAPNRIQKRSFRVDRIKNAHFKGRNGPRQLLKTYRKYRMPVPDHLLDAVANQIHYKEEPLTPPTEPPSIYQRWFTKSIRPASLWHPDAITSTEEELLLSANNHGIVTATPQFNDVEFLSPITIGTDSGPDGGGGGGGSRGGSNGGQTINVDFDSGSADLWVFSTQLPASSKRGHQLHDHTKSASFRLLPDQTFKIRYGDGSAASGVVGTDTVQVGGVTVTSQAIEMATSVSEAFVDDTPNNGLLGLAFSKLSQVKPTKQKTFFENLMPSLAEPVWTADLRRNRVGAYEFGRIDRSKFRDELTWVPSNTTEGFWQFTTDGFAVGGNGSTTDGRLQQLRRLGMGGGGATTIVDTGTTLMLVAKEVSDAYYGQVAGAKNSLHLGGMTFPCEANLPDLFLDVGGVYTARIRGEDINFTKLRGGVCYGGIQPTQSKQQIWGDVFFRSQFVVFHGGNRSLGMAPHA